MVWNILSLVIMLLSLASIETTNQRFNVELYDMTCTNVTEQIQDFKCDFFKLSTSNYATNMQFMFKRKMGSNFGSRIWINVRPQLSKKEFRFFDLTVNACESLRKPLTNRLLKSLMNELRRSSNSPLACPFKVNFLYKMMNFSVTDEYFPLYTPIVNFTFAFELLERDQVFAVVKVIGATVPKAKV